MTKMNHPGKGLCPLKSPGKECADQQSCIDCPLCTVALVNAVIRFDGINLVPEKQYILFLNGETSHYTSECFKPPDHGVLISLT